MSKERDKSADWFEDNDVATGETGPQKTIKKLPQKPWEAKPGDDVDSLG